MNNAQAFHVFYLLGMITQICTATYLFTWAYSSRQWALMSLAFPILAVFGVQWYYELRYGVIE